MNNNKVCELHILEEGNSVFSGSQYTIPLYQRDYAWGEKEIIQLIEDIDDVIPGDNYYIGSLIVAKHDGFYEVVDGQQRLTTLFLLLCCLDDNFSDLTSLTFECRERSNYTLRHIHEIIADERDKFDADRLQSNIISGQKVIHDKLSGRSAEDIAEFLKKLHNVVLYRIEVPEHTDLNHYFEIMNTRGEQLEQSDVLKAKLMSYLTDKTDQQVFATIWDACRDMTGYVQMHLPVAVRAEIFDWNWGMLPSKRLSDYRSLPLNRKTGKDVCITDIIRQDFRCSDEEVVNDEGMRVRFESIIDFQYFLIHTLKVYLATHPYIVHHDSNEKIIDELMDDKKLTATFEKVLNCGRENDNPIDGKHFAKEFVVCLLRIRYLFDKYIIKREYVDDSSNGEWSLKELRVSGQQSNKRAYYNNTRFSASHQRESTSRWYHSENLMLQSALRVSYTSPKIMHWITQLLIWLTQNADQLGDVIPLYHDEINRVARKQVEIFLQEGDFKQGVNTHHMVLNYLDYLLWQQKRNVDFTFEFRNSVEHWYPRNPSEGTFDRWEDEVDSFGNLCLIQRNVNSKFSNMAPEAKKSTFKEMIQKGSLKLRLMSQLTQGQNASQAWKDSVYKEHEIAMLDLLRSAVGANEEEE